MKRSPAVKILSERNAVVRPKVVGVIASLEELRAGMRMRTPPDFFELRLDYLPDLDPNKVPKLRRPIIITARHPAEGGCSRGRRPRPTRSRGELLLKWLSRAQFVDVELRSLRELDEVWLEAARLKIKRICSVHDLAGTAPHVTLDKQFQRARKAGADIFKLVTRADTLDDFIPLLEFVRGTRGFASRGRSPSRSKVCAAIQYCVMAIGKFGPISRLLFPEFGSAFIYAPLSRPFHVGQLTLEQLRSVKVLLREFLHEKPLPPAKFFRW
jgi:3-dehydroquinate dehydratase type I